MNALANTPEAWSARAALPLLEAVGWSAAGQRERFNAIVDRVGLQEGETIMDYGCGLGDLVGYLPLDRRQGYRGYDWAPGMIERARRLHQGRVFCTHQPLGMFDAVVCIGTFNLPGGWSKERTWHTLRHLWDTTGCRVLVASLYAGDDERCLVYTEDEVEAFGRQLAFGAEVTRHRANDLLLVARR